MKTIDIKGKAYVPVSERLRVFREKYPDHSLTTEVVELTETRVVLRAVIGFGDVVLAHGMAYEDKDSTFINKTSFIENCETSAWGRAIFNFMPIGEGEVASFEEVANAVAQKEDKPWLNHQEFNDFVTQLNNQPDDDLRKALYDLIDIGYRMKKDYRRQLLEIVDKRDINV